MDREQVVVLAGIALCVAAAAYVSVSTRQIASRSHRAAMLSPSSLGDACKELAQRFLTLSGLRTRSQTMRRKSDTLRQFPEMLDVLTLGLSAGLSFDASLELYCRRSETELARLFSAAQQSWRMGMLSRDEALRRLAGEVDMQALRRFSQAVSQALYFGSPLTVVLERQAQAMRDEQRSEIEERIEKVPVRMLIPLGTLIVPAMLLAILGPLLSSSLALE